MSDATVTAPVQGSPTPAADSTSTPAAGTPAAGAGTAQGTVLGGDVVTAPTGEAKATTAAPVDFEPKFPEGAEKDDALAGEFKKFAKEQGLDPEKAQASFEHLVKTRATTVEGLKTRAAEAHQQRVKGWSEALKADKEVGGAQYDQNVTIAMKAVTKFGSPEFTEFLNKTGLGSHPEMVRLMLRVGKAISEDTIAGATGNASAKTEDSQDEKLRRQYPNSPGLFKP
jgi:hypothetical protein